MCQRILKCPNTQDHSNIADCHICYEQVTGCRHLHKSDTVTLNIVAILGYLLGDKTSYSGLPQHCSASCVALCYWGLISCMHHRDVNHVAATLLAAGTMRQAVTPQRAFVSAKSTWRASSVTSASRATSTWPSATSLAARPASATATPPSVPRPAATLRVGGLLWCGGMEGI